MPKIVCRACGREIYTTSPVELLFAEERRCPRCGAYLEPDRRTENRRTGNRRGNPADDPGPPKGEQRVEDRRKGRRRRGDYGPTGGSPTGWIE